MRSRWQVQLVAAINIRACRIDYRILVGCSNRSARKHGSVRQIHDCPMSFGIEAQRVKISIADYRRVFEGEISIAHPIEILVAHDGAPDRGSVGLLHERI